MLMKELQQRMVFMSEDIIQIMGGLERNLLELPVMSRVRKLPFVVKEHITRMALLKTGSSF
eukprot:9736926-Ditylum_brightwellii.AAC.1